MSVKRIPPGSFVLGFLIIVSVNLIAKVSTIRDMKKFDDKVSAAQPLTVVMAYTQSKGLEKDQRKAIREAEQGLSDASRNDVHQAIRTVFAKVNLDKIPHIADQYQLSTDAQKVSLLFFKRGRLVVTENLVIDKDTAQDAVYSLIMKTLNDNFGNYINDLLEELAELQREVEIARAQAPHYVVDPFYNSGWDYWYHGYHGYYDPYYYPRHRYYRPHAGLGFYFNLVN